MGHHLVERHGCGEVVDRLVADDLLTAVERPTSCYSERCGGVLTAPLESFALESYFDAYGELFRRSSALGRRLHSQE